MSARRSAAASRAQTTALGASRAAFRNSRFAIQNTAFQIGDFAVQVASGTSAMRAFAQQTPQLLGGFGVAGAVAGAVVAVAAALVPVLFDFGDAAEDAADGADALTDATKDLTDATGRLERLQAAAEDVDALAKKYGDLAGQMYRVIRAQEDLARRDAGRALAAAVGTVSEEIGAAAAIARRETAGFEAELAAAVNRIRETLRIGPADFISVGTPADNDRIRDLRERVLAAVTEILDADEIAAIAKKAGVSVEEAIAGIADEVEELPGAAAAAAADAERAIRAHRRGVRRDARSRGTRDRSARRLWPGGRFQRQGRRA